MKKFFVFLIVAVMTVLTAVAFVGCDENTGTADNASVTSETTSSDDSSVADVSSSAPVDSSVTDDSSVSGEPASIASDSSAVEAGTSDSEPSGVDVNTNGEDETAQSGTFYTLSDAYDNGWLTKENIMCISYYCTGEVKEVTERNDRGEVFTQTIDFTPSTSAPVLNEKTERIIKNTHYEQHPVLVEYNGEYDLVIDCYGIYNGCYVITIDSDIWEYGTSFIRYDVADIAWAIAPPGLTVFRYN